MDEQLANLLAQLRPEAQPQSVLWWPPSWGWLALLAAVACGFVALVLWLRWRKQRRLDCYFIDEALTQLRLLSSKRMEPRAQVQAINAILKQAALSAYPNANCANLVGWEWLSFLDSKWRQGSLQEHSELLEQRYQRAAVMDEQAVQDFAAQSKLWLIAQRSNRAKRQ